MPLIANNMIVMSENNEKIDNKPTNTIINSDNNPTKIENSLPPLEEITQIPVFNTAKSVKILDNGHVIVDGVERKISKVSAYLIDNISIDN